MTANRRNGMKISFEQVCRDYLALRGESPDLLPLLEEGEGSAVLTLTDELRVRLPAAAVAATMETPLFLLDETGDATGAECTDRERYLEIRLPDDYLKLHTLLMPDWREPVKRTEPGDSLRWALGAEMPDWMVCRGRPMVVEDSDGEGKLLKVYGTTAARPSKLLYVPRPHFDGTTLTISGAAYEAMKGQFIIHNS